MFKRFLLLFLIAQPAFSFHLAAQSTEAEKYYLEGLKWADPAWPLYPLAVKNLHQAIVADSTNAKYHYEFGKVLRLKVGPYYALPEFSKAIALDPKFVDAYISRGEAYFHMLKPSQALADYEKAYKFNTVDSNKAYFLKEYINPAKKHLETVGDIKPDSILYIPHIYRYLAYSYAAMLKGKWLKLSIQDYQWAASNTYIKPIKEESQWKDPLRLQNIRYSNIQASDGHLNAIAVTFYLEKVLQDKPLPTQLDSIAKYISLKTDQLFYSAALVYQHFLNEGRGYTSVALLKYCSADRQRIIKAMQPYLSTIDKTPINYHAYVPYAPMLMYAWNERPLLNAYSKYDPKKVEEASPDIKKQSVGYMYTGPYEYDQDLYLIFDYNQYKDQFYVLHYAAELSKSDKLNQRQATRFVWMHIPDLRVGYKNKTLIQGKNYQICTRCNGSHVERYTTGGGATYNKISTDHLDSRKDQYVKSGGTSAVKANYRECGQCRGRGYTEQ